MRLMRLTSTLLLLAACAVLPLHAQSPGPLTLEQATAWALDRHPDLGAARHDIAAAQAAVDQAGTLPNPELSVSLEDTRQTTRTTAVQLHQRVELGGQRGARLDIAHLAQEAARAQLDARTALVGAQVRASFHEALAAQARFELAQASSQLAGQAVEAAARRVAAGKVSPVEEARARLAMSGVALDTAQAQTDLLAARTRLAAHWSANAASMPALSGRLQAPLAAPTLAQLEQSLNDSPDLRRARLDLARKEALAELERRRATPDLTVGLGTQRNNELGRSQPLIGVSMALPLFDRNRGNLDEARARVEQARDELSATTQRLSVEVQMAWAQLDSARQQAHLIDQDLLPQALQTYQAATTGFSLGKFGFLDVLDAQRTLFQARLQKLRALADSQRFASELERLLGQPLDQLAATPTLVQTTP